MTESQPPPSATKGLTTVALLKVNFDAGRDHIAMFEPFVFDALISLQEDGFTAEDVRDRVRTHHQLSIPVNTVRTLLGRAVKRRCIRREAGRYFRRDSGPGLGDLEAQRREVEERQRQLADALVADAARHGLCLASREEALAMILDFIESHQLSLALASPGSSSIAPPGDQDDRLPAQRKAAVTARFLRDTALGAGPSASVLQEMLEGYILQNALLLKDISAAARRFNHLRAFFDSKLLFGALGYRGTAIKIATREMIELLVDTGASLEIFDVTIMEMRRILAVYEDRIGTHDGRLSLHQTEMTRYFLTNRYSQSDIRTETALLERNLRALGFRINEVPLHQLDLTLGEESLASRLAKNPGDENVPRVQHDVDCVAGILTLRKGRRSDSWDDARSVFVTTSGLTVRNTVEWYKAEGEQGLPPIVHYLTLSNLAWLKRPAAATQLKLHELVALCGAALRPSPQAWNAFLGHLQKLEASGELSSDEVTALMATSLVERALTDEQVDDDTDAATLSEVVDRVKAAQNAEAENRLSEATLQVTQHKDEALRLRTGIERFARRIGQLLSWTLCSLLTASLILGAGLSIASTLSGSPPSLIVTLMTIWPLAVGGLLSVLWGFNLKDWRRRLEEWVARRIRRRFTAG